MTTIITRAGKGSALTNAEGDQNIINLNTDKPDFESGTWTPVITDLTNNATMSGGTQGGYVKIGKMVFLSGLIQTTALGSVSGTIYISGIPFAAGSSQADSGAVAVGESDGLAIGAGQVVSVFIGPSDPRLTLLLWDTTAGTSTLQASEWTDDGRIRLSFAYLAAS